MSLPDPAWQTLCDRVYGDPELALRLRRIEPARFVAALLQLAAEIGCEVTEAQVAGAIAEGRLAWDLRWTR